MSLKSLLPGWTVPLVKNEVRIRSYSTTADVLAFRRCRRQYGYFGVRGFSSATSTQLYFGTLVHDVLDRITRDRRAAPTRALPSEEEIQQLVQEAHDRLIRSGVRTFNAPLMREKAARLIHRFVHLVGEAFFPHIRQTEYRLERALKTPQGRDYILQGVVDILAGAVSHALGLNFPTSEVDEEIWDYKSGRMPAKGASELVDYEYQMQVYAELYRQQTGHFPARAVLIFLGELDDDELWKLALKGKGPGVFPRLFYPLHPSPVRVKAAMQDFHNTVELIEEERAKPYEKQWAAPSHSVEEQTCEACDIRFRCSSFPQASKQRRDAL
ncbi:PD-(D/E)XK nuclease family protein [Myxococcus sp. RHSTA-1-4]|uniref:PD-(D/E)XK nuclease family protein n=1 Tax=Myxococcus sp. RHSTA-1-4 TaxID=2874601 RepID=UPI001CC0AB4B|nr:PD-(D/E)XK nuclease family protein [Myxococcus sp. RHSTA-1-4]MBZ4418755.1 PD-(D/E)XK nuclease family protein [Myxococcus sp. RHSTA-1-4]